MAEKGGYNDLRACESRQDQERHRDVYTVGLARTHLVNSMKRHSIWYKAFRSLAICQIFAVPGHVEVQSIAMCFCLEAIEILLQMLTEQVVPTSDINAESQP